MEQGKFIFMLLIFNAIVTSTLLVWSHSTESMGLAAYTYITIFDIFALLTSLLTIWVQQKSMMKNTVFSFGYERFEVLAVFSSTMLAQLGALFVVKECVERIIQQPDIHTGRLLPGTCLAFVAHLIITYSIKNRAFNHVIDASSSSWLQEHVADMSESLCHYIPGLSKLLLPRINPFALVGFSAGLALVLAHFVIDVYNYHLADSVAALSIAIMTCGTMFPMASYSGKILLQTTPSHMIGQLDKCLREASTLDGVLEFRHEHFWTLSFGKLAGSLHVRIRRDANEQMVLAHVTNRLSTLVSNLTIQIFKDDWATRASVYQLLGNAPKYGTGIGTSSPPRKLPSPSSFNDNIPLSAYRAAPVIPSLTPFSSPVSGTSNTHGQTTNAFTSPSFNARTVPNSSTNLGASNFSSSFSSPSPRPLQQQKPVISYALPPLTNSTAPRTAIPYNSHISLGLKNQHTHHQH
ncbi:zinc transporter 6-A-like isoform X2 [Tubulanus polymorphus]|uniref:zinc transporter 6-A-like isoform X2 n=1 Tax=Tubulanus polymorphus TaxID=672921 RepID=UPI003DA4EB7F